MKKIDKESGFTLIELLVVISIIGLLTTVATVALISARKNSRDAKRMHDAAQIVKALEMYNDDFGQYPCDEYALNSISACIITIKGELTEAHDFALGNRTDIVNKLNEYLLQFPRDPLAINDSNWDEYEVLLPCNIGSLWQTTTLPQCLRDCFRHGLLAV